jgi:acetyl-CoA decarbonylase/synthase, CODH/ACS complex subunit gamma
MYRHEFTYKNPTAIAIDVTDEMPESEVVSRVQKTENFSFEYIGNTLKLDMIAVRCTSDDADKFKACVKKVSETTTLP